MRQLGTHTSADLPKSAPSAPNKGHHAATRQTHIRPLAGRHPLSARHRAGCGNLAHTEGTSAHLPKGAPSAPTKGPDAATRHTHPPTCRKVPLQRPPRGLMRQVGTHIRPLAEKCPSSARQRAGCGNSAHTLAPTFQKLPPQRARRGVMWQVGKHTSDRLPEGTPSAPTKGPDVAIRHTQGAHPPTCRKVPFQHTRRGRMWQLGKHTCTDFPESAPSAPAKGRHMASRRRRERRRRRNGPSDWAEGPGGRRECGLTVTTTGCATATSAPVLNPRQRWRGAGTAPARTGEPARHRSAGADRGTGAAPKRPADGEPARHEVGGATPAD
jgi:hypothetical protein